VSTKRLADIDRILGSSSYVMGSGTWILSPLWEHSADGTKARSSDEGSFVERMRVWRHEALRLPPAEA